MSTGQNIPVCRHYICWRGSWGTLICLMVSEHYLSQCSQHVFSLVLILLTLLTLSVRSLNRHWAAGMWVSGSHSHHSVCSGLFAFDSCWAVDKGFRYKWEQAEIMPCQQGLTIVAFIHFLTVEKETHWKRASCLHKASLSSSPLNMINSRCPARLCLMYKV